MSLKDEIIAAGFDLANRDYGTIAAVLSVGRKRSNTLEIGNGTILATLGTTSGNALLDVINTAPDFRHVKPLVEQGRLMIGSPLVQTTIQSMIGTVLTQQQADTLCALGFNAAPVSPAEVARIIDGEI